MNPHRTVRAARAARAIVTAILCCIPASRLAARQADDHDHDHEDEHDHGAHFTHPLFAESLSPDTKVRLDYSRQSLDDTHANEMEVEGEYAFTEFFSIEAGMHYDPDESQFGEMHVLFKFANTVLQPRHIHLGYGLELGLPTGSAHEHGGVHQGEGAATPGDDKIYEFSPFLNAGVIAGAWEFGAWTLFDIPTNQGEQEEVGAGLRFNGSILVHASSRLDAILETFGHTGLSGPETDQSVFNVAPGVRVRPVASSPLVIGAGLALPISSDEDYDSRILVSAFWHF